jgi:hypothetical protein
LYPETGLLRITAPEASLFPLENFLNKYRGYGGEEDIGRESGRKATTGKTKT